MIPLLAAAGAISAINSIASGASALLHQVTSAGHAAVANTVGANPTGGKDFAALMAGHGFKPPQPVAPTASSAIRLV